MYRWARKPRHRCVFSCHRNTISQSILVLNQGTDILKSMTEQERFRLTLKKKEKQALKHESFLKRLESSRSPYSKSHERRLKRKTRDQVAGGMGEVQAAILALEDDIPDAVINSTEEGKGKRMQVTPKVGQIGEGKGVTLSKAQRKRALSVIRCCPFLRTIFS
ncbi:hypothetical protein AcW1_000802 [Taiwanofungus camphoratus]|nr:hypothetical protein AcV7_000822 [Antrodia cinnamomea]KAI0963837.1 hypothetical protein AcW1_000802 [Antrodia cinnamomea]